MSFFSEERKEAAPCLQIQRFVFTSTLLQVCGDVRAGAAAVADAAGHGRVGLLLGVGLARSASNPVRARARGEGGLCLMTSEEQVTSYYCVCVCLVVMMLCLIISPGVDWQHPYAHMFVCVSLWKILTVSYARVRAMLNSSRTLLF
jgi:hypothetical protein